MSFPTSSAFANVNTPFAVSAISGHLDTRTAATEVANVLFDELNAPASGSGYMSGACDLVLLFGSFHHRSAFSDAAAIIRKTVSPGVLLCVTAEAVLGCEREMEGVAGMSAIAMNLPGVKIHPWHSTPDDPIPLASTETEKVRQRIGFTHDFRATIMVGDPFTTPVTRLLPALTSCGDQRVPSIEYQVPSQSTLGTRHSELHAQRVPVIGGMASGASQPGLNVIVLDDRVLSAGAAGVSLSGNVDIQFIVSQGCRPIGKPFIITKCKDNVILELGGRKAIEALQELAQELSDAEKRLLSKGLLVGTVINEYKGHFGRGDFLVRNVMGLDQRVGGIAVGEMCRTGQTIQFHARDAATAAEDLQLLLDAQMVNDTPPFAALLFSCNGRGERLFGEPNHDLNIIRARIGDIPIAGFFAAGEFGPIGERSFLHGHTASLALLRAR